MSKTALITGITGQDGIYLAELLLEKNYTVVGVTRNIVRAKKILKHFNAKIELVKWDYHSQDKINDIVSKFLPHEIYNLAGITSGSEMFEYPVDIHNINGLSVTKILESIRLSDYSIKFCQASSSEVFGKNNNMPHTELSPMNPRTPYGASKAYADNMIKIYREKYNLFLCSAFLYNHESPLRGLNFVTRKITHAVARINQGDESKLTLGNLDSYRDWGFAGDTVKAMWLILQNSYPDDYIVATGKTHSVREFCDIAFKHLNLDYLDYVISDINLIRNNDDSVICGNPNKINTSLGWKTQIDFKNLVVMMVESDLKFIKFNKSK